MSAVARWWQALPEILRQVIRFGSVSATALVVDVAAYAALVQRLEPAALAAFIAYCTGGVWHYCLSSVFVFREEMPNLTPGAHLARFLRYFASTLAGLSVTTGTVWLTVDVLDHHPLLGKAIAVPLSFLTVFTLVRLLVFARERSAPAAA